MPSETQIQATQQRGREADRLLAEILGVPMQEQQLAPPPPPNPDDFGASFGEDDGGEAAPPAQATANSHTGGIGSCPAWHRLLTTRSCWMRACTHGICSVPRISGRRPCHMGFTGLPLDVIYMKKFEKLKVQMK